MINNILKSFCLLAFIITESHSPDNNQAQKNKDIVKAYIEARNNYDVKKVSNLVEENYQETFIDGSKEIENKKQLKDRVLWGKELDSHIKLISIKSKGNSVITIEENSNYLDKVLKRKTRKFKISYTLSNNKIQNQKVDTLLGYHQILKFNSNKYKEFIKYCEQNNVTQNHNSFNQKSGAYLRKVLEMYRKNK